MQYKIKLNKVLPHALAVIIFLVISYAYFSPLLEGKRLDQHDEKTYKGGAKEINDYREETGKEALWTNRMFVGMPAYLINVHYKGNLMQYVNRALQIGPRPGSYLFLLLLGAYFLFISLKINPWLSIAGAIAFAFSSYNFIIILAGHNTKVVAIAYVAPVLAGFFTTFRGKRLLGAAITGIFLSLQILAGHPQISYYTIFIIVFFGLSELYFSLKEKQLKELLTNVGILAIAVILAVMSNYSRLASTLEYDNYSMRSQTELTKDENVQTGGLPIDYATSWSYGIDETLTMLIPGFKGGSSNYELNKNSHTYAALADLDKNFANNFIKHTGMYWGSQVSTSGPVYLGAIIIFLFILGMFIVDKRFKWWILAVSVLGIMLAWGKNFMGLTEFFMNNVPGYNKFRTVSMTLVIPQIVIPILALMALNQVLIKGVDKHKLIYALKWSLGITGGITALFLLLPSLAGNFSSANDMRTVDALAGSNAQTRQYLIDNLIPAIEADRMSMLRSDAFRSLVFILLSGGLIYLYRIKEVKIKLNLVIALFAILFLADMWPVNKRFLNDNNFESAAKAKQPYQATQADQAILQAPGLNNRVLNLTTSPFQDAATSYFHQSIGGYHGAKMRRYQDLIDTRLYDDLGILINALQSQDLNVIDSTLQHLNVLNMLNTRYIILNPNTAPLTNRSAFGNAWLVDKYLVAESADQELTMITNEDLRSDVVLDRKFIDQVENKQFHTSSADFIKLDKYQPNKLEYSVSVADQTIAVFSEIYYEKGWNAYIDGEAVDHFRADYLLRGLVIPPGKHQIVFEFKPKTYFTGEKISYAGSGMLILLALIAIGLQFRKEEEQ